ncbi:MAG: AraC family transcriptional regulator [Acidimicrobiales bacterium]
MDALSGLLGGSAGPDPAFLLRVQLAAPFGLTLADGAALSVVVTSRGPLTLTHPDGVYEVAEGSVVLVRGERRWSLTDDQSGPATAIVHRGHRCETLTGEPLAERWSLGIRTWGNAEEASASHLMLVGVYPTVPEVGRYVLDALPGVHVVEEGVIDPALIELFGHEMIRDDLAQPVVLSRTLDLLVVLAVRHWMHHRAVATPGATRGLADPVVGPVIRLMQRHPAKRWTVASLAAECGMSRAALAKRFTEVVGVAPITLLTDWRMAVTADRLASSRDPIARIAGEVGYGSAFALSTAFKRHYGVSPHHYRSTGRGTAA